jgi:guanylate kinase
MRLERADFGRALKRRGGQIMRGTFYVLSGPSGSGKGTVLKKVLAGNKKLRYSVSATSRAPRDGEAEGKSYFFKTRAEFERLISEEAFLEYTETYGNYYGTLKAQVEKSLAAGHDIILEIDAVGARNVRFFYPDAVLMFLVAPSLEILKMRLETRGSERGEAFKTRFESALDEMSSAELYDYIIINDDAERAAADILSVIRAERLKASKNLEIINKIKGGAQL